MNDLKRVAAINDISGVGKCSLTVALPILSSAGVECAVIPTAVLSTHTGGFSDFTYLDLTDEILPISKHWANLNLNFDSIYTGYLGSTKQVEIVLEAINLLKSDNTLLLVDPVMADAGKLYANFESEFPQEIKKLCKLADIIIPNITEACFLTDTEYLEGPHTKEYINELIEKLKFICDKKIVLTGVHFDEQNLGCACFDNETNTIDFTLSKEIEGFYHGTGDVFGSTLLAALMNEKSLKCATEIAMKVVVNSIKRTKSANTDVRLGVRFEEELPNLIRLLDK